MSDSMKDLMAAFESLAESVRSVSVGNSIKRAQSKVEEIRANQELNEFEQIKAQQALAKSVGADIARFGANPFQQQQAMAALAPEIPDARMAQLERTGKGTIAEATQALQEETEQKEIEKEDRAFDRQLKLEKLRADRAERLAKMKQEGKPAKQLSRPESDKLYNLLDRKQSLEALLNDFDEKGGAIGYFAGKVPDVASALPIAKMAGFTPEAVSYRSQVMQDFNEYRRIITGAAASIPELKSLRPATITEDDTPENFKAKAKQILKAGELVAKARLKIANRQGKDISGFEEEFGFESEPLTLKDINSSSQSSTDSSIPAGQSGPAKYFKFN